MVATSLGIGGALSALAMAAGPTTALVTTLAKGGSVGDVFKNMALSAATSAAGAGVGSILGSVGGAVASGASKVVEGVKGALNIGSQTATKVGQGVQTATETAIEQGSSLAQVTESAASNVPKGTPNLPDLPAGTPNAPAPTSTSTPSAPSGTPQSMNIDTSALNSTRSATTEITKQQAIRGGTDKTMLPGAQTQADFLKPAPTAIKTMGTSGSKKAASVTKEAIGLGIQAAGVVVPAIQGEKAAKEANKISQQGLDFQKQMYAEEKSEKDRREAEKRSNADRRRQQSLLFGETLYGSTGNNQLFSGGSAGNYSLLSRKYNTNT